MGLRGHRAEEGAGISPPAAIRPLVVGNQRACELLDVVVAADLAEQVPARGTRLEGVENDIAALAVVEVSQVAPIGIRNDGAVAACERRAEQLPDGGALAGAGGAYQLEMLDLVLGCDREPRERQSVAREAATAGGGAPRGAAPRRPRRRRATPSRRAAARGAALGRLRTRDALSRRTSA